MIRIFNGSSHNEFTEIIFRLPFNYDCKNGSEFDFMFKTFFYIPNYYDIILKSLCTNELEVKKFKYNDNRLTVCLLVIKDRVKVVRGQKVLKLTLREQSTKSATVYCERIKSIEKKC